MLPAEFMRAWMRAKALHALSIEKPWAKRQRARRERIGRRQ